MIKRLTKISALILVAATVTAVLPCTNFSNGANAATKNKTVLSSKAKEGEGSAEKPSYSDEQILSMIEAYMKSKNEGCTVVFDSPVYIDLKVTDGMVKSIAAKVVTDEFVRGQLESNPDLVRGILIKSKVAAYMAANKNATQEDIKDITDGATATVNAMTDDEIKYIAEHMTSDQIKALKPEFVKEVETQVKQLVGQSVAVPVYGYKILTEDKKVKDQGFVVGGQIGGAMMQMKGEPLTVSGTNLTAAVKSKILSAIKDNLGAIIDFDKIDDIFDKVSDGIGDITDSMDDLSDAIKDFADSLGDKTDDFDDAWDKVFDRFDNEEGWGERDGYTYYYDEDGISLKGVQTIDGKTYYFNRIDGALETGWQIVDGKKCYFDKDKKYQVATQWVKDGSTWYYLNDKGNVTKSDWVNDGGKFYYLKADGKMAIGWQRIDSNWYFFNDDGSRLNNSWKWSSDYWYYLKADGQAAEDEWLSIDGKWYHFRKTTSKLETGWFRADGSWYYADGSGAMQTGWQDCSDGWCYLDPSTGMMKKNEWANVNGKDYYFNVNGIMVTGTRYVSGKKYVFNSDGSLRN